MMSRDPTSPSTSRRIVQCPTCKGDSVYAASNPSRPFCSERCKNVDFGAWATESYRLDAKPPQEGDDAGHSVADLD